MISVVILAGGRYDKELFEKCLDSVSWADEIIQVKTDRLKGSFAEWRNTGAKRAKGDWLLYVDTDEQVTPELEAEIRRSTLEYDFNAYAIPRKNFIFGREFKHSGQWPDYQKRLFRKKTFKSWSGKLHETASYAGELGYLKNPLIHIKHKNLSEMVAKTNDWSEVEAKLMFEAHHPPMNIRRFVGAIVREFWLRMIKQMAFLDGGEGIIYAMYQVFSRFVSYAKLWELQIGRDSNLRIHANDPNGYK